MTVDRFVYNNDLSTYTFPTIDNDNNNFYDLVRRIVRLPDVNGGYDLRGAVNPEKEVGTINVRFRLDYKFAHVQYDPSGLVSDEAAMQLALDDLLGLAYVGQGKLYKDFFGDERFAFCKMNNIPYSTNQRNPDNLWLSVSTIFSASLPYWFKQGTETGGTWGGFSWGDGTQWGGSATAHAVSGTSTSWTETYNGIAPTLVRVSFGGLAGTMVNPRIYRQVGGVPTDDLQYAGTIALNEELQIQCRTREVQKDGSNEYDNFSYTTADWFTLLPGSNTIVVEMDGAGNAGNVYLQYFEVY